MFFFENCHTDVIQAVHKKQTLQTPVTIAPKKKKKKNYSSRNSMRADRIQLNLVVKTQEKRTMFIHAEDLITIMIRWVFYLISN